MIWNQSLWQTNRRIKQREGHGRGGRIDMPLHEPLLSAHLFAPNIRDILC